MNSHVNMLQAIHFTHFVAGILTLQSKTNRVQTNAGDDNAEYALTINLARIFPEHFLFSRRNER